MDIQQEIEKIKSRNKRVELDKSWETSWIRRVFIVFVTYIIAGIWLAMIDDGLPWLKAFVPVGGYALSTFTIPFLKKWWEKVNS